MRTGKLRVIGVAGHSQMGWRLPGPYQPSPLKKLPAAAVPQGLRDEDDISQTSPSLTAWRPASICGTVVGLVATAPTGSDIGGTLWGVSLGEKSLDTGTRASNLNLDSTSQFYDRIQANLKIQNLPPSTARRPSIAVY